MTLINLLGAPIRRIVGSNCGSAATKLFERTAYHDGMSRDVWTVEEAREVCARAMQLNTAQRIKDKTAFRRSQDIERLAQAFRIADMPE